MAKSAATGAARHLAELVRRQQAPLLAVPLGHLADHDRAGGHVDTQRQRVGGEHGAQPPRGEQLFDEQLDRRQQAGVVYGHAARQEAERV